jgi:hypothetical protein
MKHTERLLQWFSLRSTITPLQAWRQLRIYRLSARIHNLREAGHDIYTEWLEVANAHGDISRVARYHYRGKANANQI